MLPLVWPDCYETKTSTLLNIVFFVFCFLFEIFDFRQKQHRTKTNRIDSVEFQTCATMIKKQQLAQTRSTAIGRLCSRFGAEDLTHRKPGGIWRKRWLDWTAARTWSSSPQTELRLSACYSRDVRERTAAGTDRLNSRSEPQPQGGKVHTRHHLLSVNNATPLERQSSCCVRTADNRA